MARDALDAARSAWARAARVVDEDAGLVGGLEHRRIDRHWRAHVRCLKDHRASDLGCRNARRRGITFDGAERLRFDGGLRHTSPGERGLDRVHHRWRAPAMHALGRNIRHHRSEQRGIDTTDSTAPWLISWPAHGDRDAEMRVAGLERGKLLAEKEIARCPEAEDDVDLAWPTRLSKIPRRAHHRRDPHATANQDDACRLCPGEEEGSMRGLDLSLVTHPERILQPARH